VIRCKHNSASARQIQRKQPGPDAMKRVWPTRDKFSDTGDRLEVGEPAPKAARAIRTKLALSDTLPFAHLAELLVFEANIHPNVKREDILPDR